MPNIFRTCRVVRKDVFKTTLETMLRKSIVHNVEMSVSNYHTDDSKNFLMLTNVYRSPLEAVRYARTNRTKFELRNYKRELHPDARMRVIPLSFGSLSVLVEEF